jgi:hypothetical protein
MTADEPNHEHVVFVVFPSACPSRLAPSLTPLNGLRTSSGGLNGLNDLNGCSFGAKNHEAASKLKPRDAVHVACAQRIGCDFFITCDDALIQRASRGGRQSVLQVKVVNPVEFVRNEGSRYGKG